MDLILSKKINYLPQIKGLNEKLTTFYLQVNLMDLLYLNYPINFILSLTLIINNNKYYFTNIYSSKDIDDFCNLPIGNITVIGDINPQKIITNAKIIYLNSPNKPHYMEV